jgi:cell volume regulation protein A
MVYLELLKGVIKSQFTIDNLILLFSVLLIVGVLTTKFSARLGLPSLVFFIVVGMILNKYIYYGNAYLTQLFGILALIVILFEGGSQTKWSSVRKVIVPSAILATLGVLITTAIVGIFAQYILGFSLLESLLFGAIVGSTDAAAVFAVLGSKNISSKLTATLEMESGTNDPMAILLTISLIQLIQNPNIGWLPLVFKFFWQMGFGLIVGLIMGKVATWLINKINLDSSGLYPVLAMALAILTYGVTSLLHASGLLAVYVMAMLVGNSDLTYRHSIFRFNEGFAWMMQILMFILLGLMVFPNQLLHVIGQGLLLSIVLMLIARPIGVFVSMLFTDYSIKEKLFISWGGLKGAVPIVLATYPMLAGLENSQLIFNVVFFVVLTSALLQGATLSPLAKKLGLSYGDKINVPHSLELISMGKRNSELIEVRVAAETNIVGKQIKAIQLLEDTLIMTVIRGERIITPKGSTLIEAGDILYVLVKKTQREEVQRILLGKAKSFVE